MRRLIAIVLGVMPALAAPALHATTWDEPWHEAVVREADCFVKVRMVSRTAGDTVTVAVLQHFAGVPTADTIRLRGFSMLNMRSFSVDDELQYPFEEDVTVYMLLRRDSSRAFWALPTPTSGYAAITPAGVFATYRHSYNQAVVLPDVYERTMAAIFNHLHGTPYDTASIESLFDAQLAPPAQDPPDNIDDTLALRRFSMQHVALECFYYFGTERRFALLKPFVEVMGTGNFHVVVSGIRAVSAVRSTEAKRLLMKFVKGAGYDPFLRVMAVFGLKRQDAREFLPELKKMIGTASKARVSFGGNIMDPRVGTYLPTVKEAIAELIKAWEK